MIITRKIQVSINESDKELRSGYYKTLVGWRDQIRKAANLIATHKFVQQNITDFQYIKDEHLKDFYVKDILKDEPGNSQQNSTYRIASRYLKDKNVPTDYITNLNQNVSSSYNKKIKDFIKGKASIPSYRDIPVPFSAKVFDTISVEDKISDNGKKFKDYTMVLPGHIPIKMIFGKDRSGNETIIRRAMTGKNGYKFSGSSIQITDKKVDGDKTVTKLFLLVCVNIPEKKVDLDPNKKLYAKLSIDQPIVCYIPEDQHIGEDKPYLIGSREEFLHRRLAIQEARRRAQMAAKYNRGGHGRKKKLKNVDHFKDLENNYVDYKMHVYSKMLIDAAIKFNCSSIILMGLEKTKKLKDSEKEEDKFLLRNWSYYGLETKITYKAKKYGVIVEKEKAAKSQDSTN